ncbi:unnamed protein product [Brachionus calyciflorus]|uniref:Squalene synthase n=1 Tax=Brachionus calyciflorus TaxID=104777 RepID=A0A814MAT3_9BILA|nr:unnamed protein product [Brachionus calyciflorus]
MNTELETLRVSLEQEKQKRIKLETDLEEANQKLKISTELIQEALSKYEKVYRKLISLENTELDYSEKNLNEELELVNGVLETLKINPNNFDESLEYCYKKLEKVSRSFTVVINQLNPVIRDEICIFYLVLRALDTIEDDPNLDLDNKLKLLKNFHNNIGNEFYEHDNIGDEPDYIELMRNYRHVAKIFNKLDSKYQEIIRDITKKMADGMCEFIEAKGIKKIQEYDLYCHYVAGLVGIGLTQIFVASEIEEKAILNELNLANSMGLFLQKTNIIRDYAEDVEKKRYFWPEEICSEFTTNYIEFLGKPCDNAMRLLNTMVNDALRHFNECINYLKSLNEISVFKFCSIPQVMALATLELVFNNELVFSSNVKLEKSESLKIFSNCLNYERFGELIKDIVQKWKLKLTKSDRIFDQTKELLEQIFNNF